MDITATDYLKAKFGENFNFKYDVYPTGNSEFPRFGGDIDELMEEYKLLLLVDEQNIAQTKNPRSNEWVLVDKKEGKLLAHLEMPLTGISPYKPTLNLDKEEYLSLFREINQIAGFLSNDKKWRSAFPAFNSFLEMLNEWQKNNK
jgi:hypothetical protein